MTALLNKKRKAKNSATSPIHSETISIYFPRIIAELETNDRLLDNVESKVIERGEASATIDLRFSRSGLVDAAYRVKLTALPYHETRVEVFQLFPSQERRQSLFYPIAFMMIYACVSYFILRDVQARALAVGGFLVVSAIFAYFGARYMEEKREVLMEYNEKDARLLMNTIKLALRDSQEGAVYSKDEIADAIAVSNETDAESLDSETFEDREIMKRKLDSLQ